MPMNHNITTGKVMDTSRVIRDNVAKLIRNAAISRLEKTIDGAAVEVNELEADFIPGRILANHLAFIQISGEFVTVTFKCHFSIEAVKKIAAHKFDADKKNMVSDREVFDFIKEYCNLVAGKVVALFFDCSIEMGIGLPLCTTGFYEVFSKYDEAELLPNMHYDFWRMQVNGSNMVCSSIFEVLNETRLTGLEGYEIAADSNTEGEIEFL